MNGPIEMPKSRLIIESEPAYVDPRETYPNAQAYVLCVESVTFADWSELPPTSWHGAMIDYDSAWKSGVKFNRDLLHQARCMFHISLLMRDLIVKYERTISIKTAFALAKAEILKEIYNGKS